MIFSSKFLQKIRWKIKIFKNSNFQKKSRFNDREVIFCQTLLVLDQFGCVLSISDLEKLLWSFVKQFGNDFHNLVILSLHGGAIFKRLIMSLYVCLPTNDVFNAIKWHLKHLNTFRNISKKILEASKNVFNV